MKACDFLVIGAGIAGASAAYELGAHGRVLLLEREQAPGYHTTGRSAAMFVETYGNETIRRLTKASRTFFEAPPEGFAEHALLSLRGAMHVAREDQLPALSRGLAELRPLTPSLRRIDTDEAVAMVPVLRRDYVAAAIHEPAAMDIDVHALHQGYLRGLRARGGELITDAEVIRLSGDAGTWRVQTRASMFTSSVLVNAAGAWCDEIARLAGVRTIGLIPKRRTVITFDPPSGVNPRTWPITIDIDEEFYFRPEGGRILATPADETPMPPCDVQPQELDVALTVERVEKATTLRVRRIHSKWAGLRSFVQDKSPVVGMDEVQGFFWLGGQGGYGIQTAPAVARSLTALVLTDGLPDDLSALGLGPEHLAPGRLKGRGKQTG